MEHASVIQPYGEGLEYLFIHQFPSAVGVTVLSFGDTPGLLGGWQSQPQEWRRPSGKGMQAVAAGSEAHVCHVLRAGVCEQCLRRGPGPLNAPGQPSAHLRTWALRSQCSRHLLVKSIGGYSTLFVLFNETKLNVQLFNETKVKT